MPGADASTVRDRIAATVDARLDDDAEWTVSEGPLAVRLPDRRLLVRRHDGPEGADHWTLALEADGATVSKFGPFDSVGALTEQIRSLLDADVAYTVCCDG